MSRLNASHHSLSDSLYDVSISKNNTQNARYTSGGPKRVGLMTSLPTTDSRRPSDFFAARSSDVVAKSSSRPFSNVSLSSSDTSKDSDDQALVTLTPFDVVESRLSSATTASVYSTKNSDLDLKQILGTDRDLSSSSPVVSATATLSSRPLPDLPEVPPVTSSSPPKFSRQLSTMSKSGLHVDAASIYSLTRTKTRYYNPKEKKERQQLRKKLYEENNDDDVILSKDLTLVFNVPVIKKHHELYTHSQSSKSSYFSREDIVKVDDNKYNAFKQPMKPCPLPGSLSQSQAHVKSAANSFNASYLESFHDEQSYSDLHLASFHSVDTDEEVSRNISDFYALRSESYSKLVRASRDNHIYKLPHYIRSQNSIEDISLVSPEKLELIDQSRPINLPPKNSEDVSRHRKEINKVLKSVETWNKTNSLNRQRLSENFASIQQTWNKVFEAGSRTELSQVLNSEKDKLRNGIWQNQVHEPFTYSFFKKVLLLNLGENMVSHFREEFEKLDFMHQALSEQMKATKNAEFDSVIAYVVARPLINNFLQDAKECSQTDFRYSEFVKNFRHLLYLKSLSEGGLKKHHQLFLIPVFLILFRGESVGDVYLMIEMFDSEIFLDDLFADLAERLSRWTKLSSMSSSSLTYKVLSRFSTLDEFESLNSSTIFELILQFNDKLPLSLSAPSTPVLSRGSFFSFNKIIEENANGLMESVRSASSNSDALLSSALTFNSSVSSSYMLLVTFLQLLVIFSRSRKRNQNYIKLLQSFLLTVFDYYHIGWVTSEELIKNNASIRLNHTNDQWVNLESFTSKWRQAFKKM